MANEKLLIDANALIRRLFPIAMNLAKEYGSLGGAVSGVIGHIYDEPTVDAVEVVRCKECKYYCQDKINGVICRHPELDFDIECYDHWINTNPDDFCSYGERREG